MKRRTLNQLSSPVVVALVTVFMVVPHGVMSGTPRPIEPLANEQFTPITVPTLDPTAAPSAFEGPWLDFPDVRPKPTRPVIAVPAPRAVVVTPRTAATSSGGAHRIGGLASWYCKPGVSVCTNGYPASGSYAAAGPKLRVAICGKTSCTGYKGKTVRVNGKPVTLIDYCQCYWNEPKEKLIDLYNGVWVDLGRPSSVTITW